MALTLTTEIAVVNWLSTEGLENHVDHSAEALLQANDDALGEMEYYLTDRYTLDSAAVLNSSWLKQVCKTLTLFHLFSQRNGQPAGNIVALRDDYLAKLEKIRTGEATIPGVPSGSVGAPFLLNMSVQHDAYPALFVDKKRSMLPASPTPLRYRPNEFPRPPRA